MEQPRHGSTVGVGIDHLRAFLAVAEELSFRRAAARLYIAPTRLSRRIRELEQSMAVMLFQRTTRRVSLTPAGETLVPRVRDVVRRFDELDWAPLPPRPTIQVGFGFGVHAVDRRAIDEAVRRAIPGGQMTPHSGSNEELAQGVREGDLDLALLHALDLPGLSMVEIRREEFGVAIAASHPLASLERIPVRALGGLTFVALSEEPTHLIDDALLPALRAAGVERVERPKLTFWGDVVQWITAGGRFAILPLSDANPLRRALDDPDVAVRPLDDLRLRFPTAVAWRGDRLPADAALAAIVAAVRGSSP